MSTPSAGPPVVRPADRYGDAPRPGRRRAGLAVLGTLAAAVLAFFVVVAYRDSHPAVTTQLVGFTARSATELDVTVSVQAPADRAVTCSLQALDASSAVVGTGDALLPAGTRSRTVTVSLATLGRAVGASVQSCSLVPATGSP